MRHYGLQAKSGDVSGGVNSAIDELIGQADDAFKMPCYEIASTEPRYISNFIVAISGALHVECQGQDCPESPSRCLGLAALS